MKSNYMELIVEKMKRLSVLFLILVIIYSSFVSRNGHKNKQSVSFMHGFRIDSLPGERANVAKIVF